VTHETTTQTRNDDERLQKLKEHYRDARITQIAYELGRRQGGSEEYEVLHSLLNDARATPDAPEQQRYRELKRLHWIGAVIGLASVVALWIQACRPSQPSAAPANPPAAISPVPTELPTVTSPAATAEESVPPLEDSAPTPEEAVPPPEEAGPAPEESAPTAEELVPAPEEAVSPPEEAVPPPEEAVPTLEESMPPPVPTP